MSAHDLVALVRAMEADHGPDGWPAVQMAMLTELADEVVRLRAQAVAAVDRCADIVRNAAAHGLCCSDCDALADLVACRWCSA